VKQLVVTQMVRLVRNQLVAPLYDIHRDSVVIVPYPPHQGALGLAAAAKLTFSVSVAGRVESKFKTRKQDALTQDAPAL
jgi:hypothetical protein